MILNDFFQLKRFSKSNSTNPDSAIVPRIGKVKLAVKLILAIFTLGIVVLYAYFSVTIAEIKEALPSPDKLTFSSSEISTVIYDRNDQVLYQAYGNQNRELVMIEDLPEHVVWAFLAAEDAEYYDHQGVDYTAILRCSVKYIENKITSGKFGDICGGSTITQQLVRNTIAYENFGQDAFNREDLKSTLHRKIRESLIAIEIEKRYSKDEILQIYLNEVPLGGVNYGIQAASFQYFGKDAKDLTLAESALLAGLLPAPSSYNPIFGTNPEYSTTRKIYVLDQLTKNKSRHSIGSKEIEAAYDEELTFTNVENLIKAPHFVFYVRDQILDEYNIDILSTPGLKVKTTLDLEANNIIEEEIEKGVDANQDKNINNGAAVAIDPKNFEIIGMVGSANFSSDSEVLQGQYNVATASRQPASTFKPYVYLASFIKGYNTGTTAPDLEQLFNVYHISNPDKSFDGLITSRKALARSRNIPAVYFLELVGYLDLKTVLGKAGINHDLDIRNKGLSLALGAQEMSLLDNVSGYTSFASGGLYAKPAYLISLTDVNNPSLVLDERHKPQQVFDETSIYQLNWILCDLGNYNDRLGDENSYFTVQGNYNLCGKTGTTDGPNDAYGIVYNKNLVLGVWYGNSNNEVLVNGWSYKTALPTANMIFNNLDKKYLSDMYTAPTGIASAKICSMTGEITDGTNCKTDVEDIVYNDSKPLKNQSTKTVSICKENSLVPTNIKEITDPGLSAELLTTKTIFTHRLELPKYESIYRSEVSKLIPNVTYKSPDSGECPIPEDIIISPFGSSYKRLDPEPDIRFGFPQPNKESYITETFPNLWITFNVTAVESFNNIRILLDGVQIYSKPLSYTKNNLNYPEAKIDYTHKLSGDFYGNHNVEFIISKSSTGETYSENYNFEIKPLSDIQ